MLNGIVAFGLISSPSVALKPEVGVAAHDFVIFKSSAKLIFIFGLSLLSARIWAAEHH
jgi:hypothetical protein